MDTIKLELTISEALNVLVGLATVYSRTGNQYFADLYDKIEDALKGEKNENDEVHSK